MAPYETMLKSTTYERMRAEHPAQFSPASVFFTHDARSAIDRRNSFRVKAALVYKAVTGHHADDRMLGAADRLLLALANACHSAIHGTSQQHDLGNGPTKNEENGKEQKVDDEPAGSGSQKVSAQQKVEKADEPGNGNDPKASTEQKEDKAGEPAGSGTPKASTEKEEEKPERIDQVWDAEHKRLVDGIFLVVGFLPRLMDAIGKSDDRDGVDESFKSRHMHHIVTDVIKLENQLPLKDLLDVAGVVEGVINETVASEEFKHVKHSIGGGEYKYKLPFTRDSFGDVVHDFCWYYSPFVSKKKAPPPADGGPFKGVATDDKMAARTTLLDFLHQSVVPAPRTTGARASGGGPSRMPAAKELRRSGIRLQATETGRAEVEFKEQWATLRLPALAYDFKVATVARNLLAREHEEQSKPVTRYFQMMNELVEDAVDVRILRRAGVVRGGSSGAAQEVHELIKNIDGLATYPSVYMAMDREIQIVKQHHDKRMTNFFVRNRPGVIWASSVAAFSVVAIVAVTKKRG